MAPGHGAGRIVRGCAIAVFLLMAATSARAEARDGDGIYVVGALHALHEKEESFDYAVLADVIARIDPGVMLLEVRPDELAERKETPGRPEYPAVIWPMLEEADRVAIAMEPGDPLFTEMVTRAGDVMTAFERDRPADHAFLSSYNEALDTTLMAHWSDLSRTHDDVTANLTRARYVVRFAVVGDAVEESQTRWDAHMIEQARRAIDAHPGKRVLVLGSYRNRHAFVEALRADYPGRVVDMEQWLGRIAP